jgi:hypothetical protein
MAAVRARPLRAASICVVAAVLLPFLARGDAYVNGLVVLMFLCLLVPAWRRWQAGRLDLFETVNVVGAIYFVYFGLGALWVLGDPVNVAYDSFVPPYVPRAVLCCLLGYVALLAGYFGPWFRGPAGSPWEEVPRGTLFLVIPGLVGLLGSLAEATLVESLWLGQRFSGLMSSAAQLSPLWMFAWALFWMLFFSGRMDTHRRRLLLLLFVSGTGLIVALSMTDKSLFMSLAGVPLIALWYARRKFAWRSLLILLLLLIFVVFPVYNTFRVLDARIPWNARVSMTSGIMGNWDLDDYRERSVVTFQARLALINSVAVVVRDVPRWVPYSRGATIFLPVLYMSVPRVFWPDKPYFAMGRQFGETFRVVHILDQGTRVSVTVPGELYWNFDLPGVIVGMGLWGLALRFLYRRYGETGGLDPVRRAIHVVLLVQFVHFGGGLAGQSAALVRTLLLLEAYRWIGRRAGWVEAVVRDSARGDGR